MSDSVKEIAIVFGGAVTVVVALIVFICILTRAEERFQVECVRSGGELIENSCIRRAK